MKKQVDQKQGDLPLGLSKPAQRALAGADIWQLDQLAKRSEAEIKELHGIGPNVVEKLRGALSAKGMSFADGKKG